jgi:hypothetical protein
VLLGDVGTDDGEEDVDEEGDECEEDDWQEDEESSAVEPDEVTLEAAICRGLSESQLPRWVLVSLCARCERD